MTGKLLGPLLRLMGRKKAHVSNADVGEVEKKLHYHFKSPPYLTLSLTHKSFLGPDDKDGIHSNERLEFLGDAVLNCLTTEHLYHKYPRKPEGQLSKMKSLIVSRKILGEVALDMDLGPHLILGVSEKKSGGQKRKSILSNAFEAVLGAIYLDGGLDESRNFLNRVLFCKIEDFISDERHVNYKSRILEMTQRDGFGMPHYSVIAATGPEHARRFTVGIQISGISMGRGTGTNKKIAQQRAAQEAFAKYDKDYILSRSKGASEDELLSD